MVRGANRLLIALAVSASLPVRPAAPAAAASELILNGQGLTVAGQPAKFGTTSRTAATALVAAALGKPVKVGSHGECGNGDIIAYAEFVGGFELAFVKGKLSGWTADGPRPQTARHIGVGMTLAVLRRAYPDIYTDPGDEKNGGLGPSFQREGGPNGWLDGVRSGSKITGLFAGETCLSGV